MKIDFLRTGNSASVHPTHSLSDSVLAKSDESSELCTSFLSVLLRKLPLVETDHEYQITQGYILPLGTAVAQFVEALRYKSGGRGFDFRWCHRNFSLT